MKLSKKSINELRKVVEEELRDYEKSELVKFDRKTLEMLLFNDTKYGFKYPAWTGPFLRKIDLSEISFAEVLFDAEKIIKCGLEDENFIIDLSGTNATIDFKSIAEASISKCDFSDMDLSKAYFNYLNSVDECKFNNSTIKFKNIHTFNNRISIFLAKAIKQGAFDGAYINGSHMLTMKEKQEKAERIRKEYYRMKETTTEKIIKAIHKK